MDQNGDGYCRKIYHGKAKCVLTWFSAPLRLYKDIQQDSKLSVVCLSFPQGYPSENNYLVVPFLTQEELKHCSEL